jgi:NADH-quinone oxidoreductase subunit L
MILFGLVGLPLVAGAASWGLVRDDRPTTRGRLAGVAGLVLAATLGLAVAAAVTGATTSWAWGAGIELVLASPPLAGVVAVTVPAVALPTALYAAAQEPAAGSSRLVGLLVAFTGAMELVVVAADLLTLLIGWELVAALSWALIGHHWREPDRPAVRRTPSSPPAPAPSGCSSPPVRRSPRPGT